MKVITPFGARVIQHWAPEEVTPPGGSALVEIFQAIRQQYSFSEAPNGVQFLAALAQAPATGGSPAAPVAATFRSGFFNHLPVPQLDYFVGSGIAVVTMQRTEDCDEFLDNLTTHLQHTLGLRPSQSKRTYVSALVVEFEKGIENQIAAIGRAAELIREEYGQKVDGGDFSLERIVFGRDGFKMASSEQLGYTALTIERRAGQPFEANRYYCSGPFRTKALVQLLEKIEEAFA